MTTIDARFRDATLPITDRVEILLGQMTIAEKAGLFFQTMILPGADGELSEGNPATGLLREHYGFDGIVCTDWGLVNDSHIMGDPFPARAWGVEHLTPGQRMVKLLDAGVDQFGGEACPQLLIDLVEAGEVTEERLDVSARRLLREKFVLGLFDRRTVDVERARKVVGAPEFTAAGAAAQRAAFTLLTNTPGPDGGATLPLAAGVKLYVEGVDEAVASGYGTVVATPAEADVAILRLQAPWETPSTCSPARPSRKGRCRSTCPARWPLWLPTVPTCRSTPPTRCSASATACATPRSGPGRGSAWRRCRSRGSQRS